MTMTTRIHVPSTRSLMTWLLIGFTVALVFQWGLSRHYHQHHLIRTFDQLTASKETFLAPSANTLHVQNALAQDQQPISPPRMLPQYHMVFSSSCSDQQNWESLLFFHHARRVGQPGTVTRIASGCRDDQEATQLQKFHENYIATMNPNFHLHLTPDYSRVQLSEGKYAYKYMNKPYGLRHWMENALGLSLNKTTPKELNDGIVMLMDPDMVLLRPLYHDFTKENVIWVEAEPKTKIVQHGLPIAQQDGYLRNEWMKLDFAFITNRTEGNYVTRPIFQEGPKYWNTGPPYLATVQDMYQIAVKWTEYAPRVVEIHPVLFAEMYGFIIATVQLKLPHTLIRSIVVSEPTSNDREGWPYVDALPDQQVCAPLNTTELPIGLHYCKRYLLGPWFFSKYRLKKNIMNCDKPLLKPPPSDLVGKYDYTFNPPPANAKDAQKHKQEKHPIGQRQAKREAFMLCQMTEAINEALIHHKQAACGPGANLNRTYTVHDDPTNY